MNNGFDKDGFMSWLKEEFPGAIDTQWSQDLVENIINYGINHKCVSKDQFAYFVSDILPEVNFLDVARFCVSDWISDATSEQISKDEELEKLWEQLEDVLFIEETNGTLVLASEWNGFEAGTDRESIWYWFDERHSKGVGWLLNG